MYCVMLSWVDDSDAVDRSLKDKLSQLLAEGEDPEGAVLDAIAEEEEEEDGCCKGNSDSNDVLCAKVLDEDDCGMMGPCHWAWGDDADCDVLEEIAVDSAKMFVFGGGSSIANVMDTQLSMTTMLGVLFAATMMHSVYRCWSRRRRSKKETLEEVRVLEFEDCDSVDSDDEEDDDEGRDNILSEENMYFQYV